MPFSRALFLFGFSVVTAGCEDLGKKEPIPAPVIETAFPVAPPGAKGPTPMATSAPSVAPDPKPGSADAGLTEPPPRGVPL